MSPAPHPSRGARPAPKPAAAWAVVFDFDGVIVDTAEAHYQSWRQTTHEFGIPFGPHWKDALRGLSREESLRRLLGEHWGDRSAADRQRIMDRKNELYLESVRRWTVDDVAPGGLALLQELSAARVPTAVASSSRNARPVLEQVGLSRFFQVIVDGSDGAASKPDPQVFLLAAERLGVLPGRCVVIEDAESGVAAARAAGMNVVAIGDPARLAGDLVVASLEGVSLSRLAELLTPVQ
jgi:beta-phosphoglucomutase